MPAMINDFERAEKMLHGILLGIIADGKITVEELKHLKEWLEIHKNLSHMLPFCEVYEMVERVLADGVIDQYEHEELMNYINVYDSGYSPLDDLKEEMLLLHGFIQGVGAAKRINSKELKSLKRWIIFHESVIDKWPFSELYNHLERILDDGVVTIDEQNELLNFINSFSDKKSLQGVYDESVFVNRWMETDAPSLETISGIIDNNCKITVDGKLICITGVMKVKRGTVIVIIIERGGIHKKNVTHDLDFLVIGQFSNPCWKYTTYGGKIEKAMEYKKQGSKINIISESDFLVALNS